MARYILSQLPDYYSLWKDAYATVPAGIFGTTEIYLTALANTAPRRCCEFHFITDSESK